jgi:hypothetical protein
MATITNELSGTCKQRALRTRNLLKGNYGKSAKIVNDPCYSSIACRIAFPVSPIKHVATLTELNTEARDQYRNENCPSPRNERAT